MNKIFFVIMVFRGNGVEKNVTNLANYFSNKGYKAYIIAGKTDGNVKDQLNKDITFFNLHTTSLFALFFHLIKQLRREKPNILVSAGAHINIVSVAAKLLSRVNVKIILKEINTFSLLSRTARNAKNRFMARFILPFFMRLLYPVSDAVVCVSSGVHQELASLIPNLKKSKMHIIHNLIDGELILKLALAPMDHPWFMNKDRPIVLAVARLVRAKGYDTLFGAFKLVLGKMPCRLVILGEGEEKGNLEKLAKKLDISENIDFLGFQDNPFKYMANSSVFVLSSIEEGFGMVVVEAMHCKIPVVATMCSGPKDIIQHEKNGILVPIDNVAAIADALFRVISDHSLAKNLSEEGRIRSLDFTVPKITEKYEKIFQRLLV